MVRPYLVERLNQSFPNPSDFKSTEEFTYAALAASAFKKVIAELLGWVDAQDTVITQLVKKSKEENPFSIGG